jgi:hypothetical protein
MSYHFDPNSKNYKDRESRNMFPTTKVTVRYKPQPTKSNDVVRIRFLERPYRFYLELSYPWQSFIKTVIFSAILIVLPYHFVYYISYARSKEDILSKTDPNFTSDAMKNYIREYKRRQREGLVEDMNPILASDKLDKYVREDGTSDINITRTNINDDN